MGMRRYREYGFTLIELLVVIVILVALAAIAIPVFLNQKANADAAAARASMVAAASVISVGFAQDNIGGLDGMGNLQGDELVANSDFKIATTGIVGWVDMTSHTYCLAQDVVDPATVRDIYTQNGWDTGTCVRTP